MHKISISNIHDVHGLSTLLKLKKAKQFNLWIYKSIKPWIRGKVIEIGSGIGNITSHLVANDSSLCITEMNQDYLKILDGKFSSFKNIEIKALDLSEINFDIQYQELFNAFDTVIAINVLEHIEDDHSALKNAEKLLKPGGQIILLLPNSETLFTKLDKYLGHYRRYNKSKVEDLFKETRLSISNYSNFNAIGIAGWFISGKIFANKTIPGYMIRIFDILIPYTSWIDKFLNRQYGLSIIVTAEKSFL